MPRILIIDDDPDMRRMVGAILDEAGHSVAYAPNGQLGLEYYRKQPFDLAIVDLVMPVMNGLMTIRELHTEYPFSRILAVTGVSPEELPRAEDYGAQRTLVKPFTQDDLLGAVDDLLQRELGWEGPVV
jgi:CheY-like chemotaxis protein